MCTCRNMAMPNNSSQESRITTIRVAAFRLSTLRLHRRSSWLPVVLVEQRTTRSRPARIHCLQITCFTIISFIHIKQQTQRHRSLHGQWRSQDLAVEGNGALEGLGVRRQGLPQRGGGRQTASNLGQGGKLPP